MLNPPAYTAPDARVRLLWLQRVLPLAILAAVLCYELAAEVLFAERVDGVLRFFIELAVFGVAGPIAIWLTLEWLRRHMELEAAEANESRRKERQLATITADSADAIILLDNDGIVQTWNRGAELIFGYTPDEVIGKHFEMLLPKSLRARGEVDRLNQELAAHGYIRNYVTQRVAKAGKLLTVELTRTLLYDEDGKRIGSSAILRDVTERERAQTEIRELNRHLESQVAQRTRELSEANQELRHRQRELEKANAELRQLDEMKSEFVSLVSHELRAPLANISGSLQLLLDEDEENALTPTQRDKIALANEQTERLTRLVKGVLNVARIEAGQMPSNLQAFDIESLIQNVLEQWRTCDTEHRWIGPSASNLPSAWGDRDRVEEVLMNLFDNAFKYSDASGTIHADARVVEDKIVVSISDQGSGISDLELEQIFDKFHRVERGDARQTYGYGLGLYISRKLIQAMGGELWAESHLGQGSTFYFSLPLAGQAHGTKSLSSADDAATRA
jgi:PAS domain S-box-containing protein